MPGIHFLPDRDWMSGIKDHLWSEGCVMRDVCQLPSSLLPAWPGLAY